VVLIALFALGASTLHLGRPIYAFRALSMWRRSWLSREVLFFSLFSIAAIVYAGLLWIHAASSAYAGEFATLLGLAATYASARLYMVAARPTWNSLHTLLEFYLSAALTGPLAASLFTPSPRHTLAHVAAGGASALALQQVLKFIWLRRSHIFELHAAGELLRHRLLSRAAVRFCGLVAIALALTLLAGSIWLRALCLIAAIGTELLGRYLFFVSVVPKNMAASYLREERAA
jgi:DMSO reductase anchor subunit